MDPVCSAFDIIVVGGGHAGIEAALATVRLGARVALVTHDRNEIGRLPCNPAIGGLGKGHLVREIDALGGEMAKIIDAKGIQFRILNRRKGPAVQAPRAQADKTAYQRQAAATVLETPGLTVIEDEVSGLLTRPDAGARTSVTGVTTVSGRRFTAPRVILCTGTFLRGLMHVGPRRTAGGREGAGSANGLSGDLKRLGLELRRLKTGTPPRILRDSIDHAATQPQPGDQDPIAFSHWTGTAPRNRIVCHLTHTTARTHEVIKRGLDRSPLFSGVISGRGPRYCPSIEDKVVRFHDRDRHPIFLEPEGLDTEEVYVNGFSTSLPADLQEEALRTVPGLEAARFARFGYAVEYDSVPSYQVGASLECKGIAGLFLAGQLLGTSGYEEAAAQGLIAGVNSLRNLKDEQQLTLPRRDSYLGVLVDDLVTKDISEPYRMFTSRAERRLYLRCDNAERRLVDAAESIGLLSTGQIRAMRRRIEAVDAIRSVLRRERTRLAGNGEVVRVAEYLKRPEADLFALLDGAEPEGALRVEVDSILLSLAPLDGALASSRQRILEQVQNDIKYEGYINKHNRLLKSRAKLEDYALPVDLDYKAMAALSFEAREKLDRIRPATLGEAERIDGVRAGDLAVLTVMLKKSRKANR